MPGLEREGRRPGTSVKWPAGIGGKGNEGVANYVQQQANSIGYVEFAYAKQNNLTYDRCSRTMPDVRRTELRELRGRGRDCQLRPEEGFLWLNDAAGQKILADRRRHVHPACQGERSRNTKVVQILDWAFKNGDAKAKELIYVPLPRCGGESDPGELEIAAQGRIRQGGLLCGSVTRNKGGIGRPSFDAAASSVTYNSSGLNRQCPQR